MLFQWNVRIISTNRRGQEMWRPWAGAAETVNAAIDSALVDCGYEHHDTLTWMTIMASRGKEVPVK